MEVWCIQLRTLINDSTQLTKYQRWLSLIVCLLVLISIEKVTTYHIIKFMIEENLQNQILMFW
jgi:hypothetical protein